RRWQQGHPWIFRSDVVRKPTADAGAVRVRDERGKWLAWALWSPRSEISLRLLERDTDASIDAAWWRAQIGVAIARRQHIDGANAYRVVHGEGDALPSLVCDRYDRWLVVQLMRAGLERFREEIVAALSDLLAPDGILARNDVPLRKKEGLGLDSLLLHGSVPQAVEVHEHGVRYLAAPW